MHSSALQFFARPRARRGFALILVMMMLVLMLTFLIAAQGSVMTSLRQLRRGEDRLAEIERAHETIEAAIAAGGTATLAADAALYARLPGIAHREGDAVVTVTPAQAGATGGATHRYLINTAGRRAGAIRID